MSEQHPDELRRKAEQQLAARARQIESLEHADLVSLAHELAVHQIELEIQNEELVRTRALAEEARDRYLDLYDFAPVGYFTLDEHNRIVEANLTGCCLLNTKRQNLLRMRFTKFILDQGSDKFYFHRKSVLEGDARQTCELRMQGANGAAFDARLESIRAGGGRLRVAVIDVTERKRAQEELRSQQRLLQTVLNTVPAGVIVSDAEGNFAYANPHVSHIFGQPASGNAFGPAPNTYQILKPDHTPFPGEELPLARAVRDEKDVMGVEMLIRRADGNEVAVLADCAPVRDTLGHVTGAVASIIDITARKRAEEALRELTRTLESKVVQRTAELEHRARQLQKLTLELSLAEDSERRRIAQILHDDLQQVLVAAKFHLGLLKNRAAQDPPQQAIAVTVDELLKDAIAKSRNLSHELNPAALHQNDLVAILAYLASEMRAKHGLTVHVDAPGEMRLQSEAVAIFLFRAAQELLFNAVKHAGVNEARIRVRRRGGYISLSVSDQGRGFDSRQQRETDGFGLFSIVERAELLGGSMRIRSHPGQGSTFRIVVPAQEAAGADVKMDWEPLGRAAESRHTQDQDEFQLRVLIADDHQIVRQAIVALLAEEDDIEVVGEATTGREAVELAEQLHPNVVVMDVTMPGMNGEEATRQIKWHLPQIRIVAVSMRNEAETIDRMTQAGADCHISKIAPVKELLAAIRDR